MRVLVDMNVVLDYLLEREPYTESARKIVLACKQKKLTGCSAQDPFRKIISYYDKLRQRNLPGLLQLHRENRSILLIYLLD